MSARPFTLRLATLALVLVVSCYGGRAETQTPKPAQIDRNGVLILIRSALLALDQANKTGNYTVLRDLGAPGFSGQYGGAARRYLRQAAQRQCSICRGVAAIDPQLSVLPQIEAERPDAHGGLLSLHTRRRSISNSPLRR